MPQLRLTTLPLDPVPVKTPDGSGLIIPRPQFRCLVRLPNTLMPRDAIIDTGSPLSLFPRGIWDKFQEGRDFEWLPFQLGYIPIPSRIAGWSFSYRMARMLQKMSLFDMQSELLRESIIAQFAEGNPPAPPGSKRPPYIVLGLWGGVLEDTNLRIQTDPGTGQVAGTLEW